MLSNQAVFGFVCLLTLILPESRRASVNLIFKSLRSFVRSLVLWEMYRVQNVSLERSSSADKEKRTKETRVVASSRCIGSYRVICIFNDEAKVR